MVQSAAEVAPAAMLPAPLPPCPCSPTILEVSAAPSGDLRLLLEPPTMPKDTSEGRRGRQHSCRQHTQLSPQLPSRSGAPLLSAARQRLPHASRPCTRLAGISTFRIEGMPATPGAPVLSLVSPGTSAGVTGLQAANRLVFSWPSGSYASGTTYTFTAVAMVSGGRTTPQSLPYRYNTLPLPSPPPPSPPPPSPPPPGSTAPAPTKPGAPAIVLVTATPGGPMLVTLAPPASDGGSRERLPSLPACPASAALAVSDGWGTLLARLWLAISCCPLPACESDEASPCFLRLLACSHHELWSIRRASASRHGRDCGQRHGHPQPRWLNGEASSPLIFAPDLLPACLPAHVGAPPDGGCAPLRPLVSMPPAAAAPPPAHAPPNLHMPWRR